MKVLTAPRTIGQGAEPVTCGLRLDLGCGRRLRPGFVGVDVSPATDATVIHDLRVVPWPWANGSVSEVWCSHFFEHLTGPERIAFMEELWRVLVPDGTATITVPYWTSRKAVMDPTHQWPPLCEESFLYFDSKWREEQLLTHYPIRCNFTHTFDFVYDPDPDFDFPDNNARRVAARVYHNVVDELQVFLTRGAGQ